MLDWHSQEMPPSYIDIGAIVVAVREARMHHKNVVHTHSLGAWTDNKEKENVSMDRHRILKSGSHLDKKT